MTHCLVNKTITDIKIADDRKAILFKTTGGDIVAKADGDCCSSTWIEHVELPALGFPTKVVDVDNLSLESEPDSDWGDVTQYYGCKILTTHGEIVIDYRNRSNGYYGGSLSWPDDGSWFYGGVYGQNISTQNWVDVK